MNLPEQFLTHWKQHFADLSTSNSRLLLAVSGGVDSVVLTHLVSQAGFGFDIVHCNFQLRGEESERDARFVQALAAQYGVHCLVERFDTAAFAAANKMGIQEAARVLRYQWFDQLLNEQPGEAVHHSYKRWLVTAHHADDNIETVLFQVFRGTGMAGLHGIPVRQGRVIRPLLFADRSAIIAYARRQQLQWVEDSSNESTQYTRNYLRHEVMPVLRQVFPSFRENMLANIERWTEAGQLYQQAVAQQLKKLCVARGNEIHVPVLKLQKAVPLKTIVFELLRPFGFSAAQTGDVLQLLDSESGRYVASPTHRVIRNRAWLIIAPRNQQQASHILIEEGASSLSFVLGQLEITALATVPAAIDPSSQLAQLDAAAIRYPLILRPWKQGDYFYPLGMQKKKKLSRFLIDQKVPVHEKERVWVVESDRRILWVLGLRIDNRFRIDSNTKQVLQLKFTPQSPAAE